MECVFKVFASSDNPGLAKRREEFFVVANSLAEAGGMAEQWATAGFTVDSIARFGECRNA